MESRDKAKKKPTRRAGHPAMERYWNLVHYFIYVAHYNSHLKFNKINPALLLYKLPVIKRRFETRGITDPVEEVNSAFRRPDIGLSVMWSGAIAYVLVFLFCSGIVFLFLIVTGWSVRPTRYNALPLLAVSFVVNHLLLFRSDKYLAYFEEFEKLPRKARRKWSLITFAMVVGILAFAIGSCMNAPRG